jgi:hypothetical protein
VAINSEVIFYDGISGTTLQNLRRGKNGTVAAAHTSGTATVQSEFIISSKGAVPSFTAPYGVVTLNVATQATYSSNYYAVGDNGSSAVILNYNSNTWSTVTTGPSGVTLYDIDMNPTYGIAVGNNGVSLIGQTYYSTFNGTNWSSINGLLSLLNVLNSVSCDPTTPTNCWLGGEVLSVLGIPLLGEVYHSGSTYLASVNLQVDGISCNSGWCLAAGNLVSFYFSSGSTMPFASSFVLSGVVGNAMATKCPSLTNCILISSAGYIYYFNGSFQGPYQISSSSLNGAGCPTAGNCVVVGTGGVIYNCALPITGAGSCTLQTSPGTVNLQDVHCNATNDCLAVGLGTNIAYRYTAGNWNAITLPATYNLRGISGIPGSTGVVTPLIWHNY